MHHLVIGGGVAGTSCAEELCRLLRSENDIVEIDKYKVILIVATLSVQRITNRMHSFGENNETLLESFDVTDLALDELEQLIGPPLHCIHGVCTRIDALQKRATIYNPITNISSVISYDNICVCTGSSPSTSEISSSLGSHPLIVSIRDSESVDKLASKLISARRVVLVGNGGIALGLAHEAPRASPQCQLIWAIRGNSLGTNFFDSSASLFLLESKREDRNSPQIIYANNKNNYSDSKGLLATSIASAESSSLSIPTIPQIDDTRALSSIFRHDSDRRKRLAEISTATLDSLSPLPPRRIGTKRNRREQGFQVKEQPLLAEEIKTESSESSSQLVEETKLNEITKTYGSSMGPAWVQSLRSSKETEVVWVEPSFDGARPTIILETSVEVEALLGSGIEGCVGGLADGAWHSIKTRSALGQSSDYKEGHMTLSSLTCMDIKGKENWPIYVRLTNGRIYGCDLVISATGAVPVTSMLPDSPISIETDVQANEGVFYRNVDGGLIVNDLMQTTGSQHVFAAGDAASVLWPRAASLFSNKKKGIKSVLEPGAKVPLWFQMRLWSQARAQAEYAARCMLHRRDLLESEDDEGDDCAGGLAFDLFAHSTHFLGFKVVLLGLYNGQGLGTAYEHALRSQLIVTSSGLERIDGEKRDKAAELIGEGASVQVQLRVTPGKEYIKITLLHGRVVGALLVGETDMEETLEHLILNRLDMRRGEDGSVLDLLNPDIDIEDFFD
jgi:hypothetical protein